VRDGARGKILPINRLGRERNMRALWLGIATAVVVAVAAAVILETNTTSSTALFATTNVRL
jgi:uncharacterized membrane protein YhiD involved in acid resistance